jgi:hypothetical protein
MTDRPVKLTVRSADVGFAEVYADGALAGVVTADYWLNWTAKLLTHADNRFGGYAGVATKRSLRELRAELRRKRRRMGRGGKTRRRELRRWQIS